MNNDARQGVGIKSRTETEQVKPIRWKASNEQEQRTGVEEKSKRHDIHHHGNIGKHGIDAVLFRDIQVKIQKPDNHLKSEFPTQEFRRSSPTPG